jgi:sigma-E factor negative regulatory protein RseB
MSAWSNLLKIGALGVILTGVAAADEPREWLSDMNRAFTELSYDGMFSYYGGDDLASLRVVHMVVDGVHRERLIHLNGAPREIIRTGEAVACILLPGDELLELESSIPSGPFARAFVRRYDRISSYYGLSLNGEDRIAGRLAVRMAVSPLDEDRFGYRLWLDKQTRMLLRSELIDSSGKRLEIFQFNQISFGEQVDEKALEPMGRDGSLVSHLVLASETTVPVPQGRSRWRAQWVPAGFTMAAADVRHTPRTLKTVDTMMFSDGLAGFSVFIEDMPSTGAASMVSRRGATVAVTHLVADTSLPHHLITLVGELPTATAQRIARSIERRSQQ